MKWAFAILICVSVLALGQHRRAGLFNAGINPSGGSSSPLPTPTAYWNMDGSSSSDESDQIGSKTLWQSNGVTSVSGLIGNARSFQSNALQYFVLTNSALVFSNRSWSLLTWQKSYPTNVTGGLFSRYIASGVSREWYFFRQGGGGNNHRYAFVYSTNGAASFVQGNMSTTRRATNSWHLVAMTVDVTNRQIRTCVMWQASTNWLTNSVAGVYNQNGTANLFIGRDGQGLYNDGAVDETSIYLDSALDESQVGWYFNSGNGRSYPW